MRDAPPGQASREELQRRDPDPAANQSHRSVADIEPPAQRFAYHYLFLLSGEQRRAPAPDLHQQGGALSVVIVDEKRSAEKRI